MQHQGLNKYNTQIIHSMSPNSRYEDEMTFELSKPQGSDGHTTIESGLFIESVKVLFI